MNTSAEIGYKTQGHFAGGILKRGQPLLILQRYGQVMPIPKNKGVTVKATRWNSLPLATTPLVEGVTPNGTPQTSTDVQCTLQQFGSWSPITDVVVDTIEDPVLKRMEATCGEQAAQTVEAVLFGILRAGTNVYYANGASRSAVNTAWTVTMQKKITRGFKRQNGMKVTGRTSSNGNMESVSLAPAFIAFCHTDMEDVIRNLVGFKDATDYTKEPLEGEIGCVHDVRYLASTAFDAFLAAADVGGAVGANIAHPEDATKALVYPVIVVCKEAFAVTPLAGTQAITPIVKNPGNPTVGDELGQKGWVGWKTYFAAMITNQLWMARGEVAIPEL